MNTKIKILIGVLVVGVLLIGRWWIWRNSCNLQCISLGYKGGICRSQGILPENFCEAGEVPLYQIYQKDLCKPIGAPIPPGTHHTCCCKPMVIINTDKKEYKQGEDIKREVIKEREAETLEEKPEKIPKDETANWKTYRNELWGFEIKYPENFYLVGRKISSEPDPWIQAIGPHEKVTIDVYRFANPKNYSLDYLLPRFPGFRKGKKIIVGNEVAIRKIDEEFPGIFTYFLRDDGFIYVVRGVSGTKEYFNRYRELIEKIENTFKFIEKKEVLEPTGIEPSEKIGWWVYKNKNYKYMIEFPNEITLEDMDQLLGGRISENSRRVEFYFEYRPVIPNLKIEAPSDFDPKQIGYSTHEFINRFISGDKDNAVFTRMLSTFRFLK